MNLFFGAALALFCCLTYTRYRWAMLTAVVLIPSYLLRVTLFGIPTNFFELMIAAMLLMGGLQSEVRTGWRQAWRTLPRPALALVTVFLVTGLISTLVSPEMRASLGILKGWVVIPIIFAYLAYVESRMATTRHQIVHSLLLSGTMTAVWGLVHMTSVARLQSIYDVPNSLALWLAPLLVIAVWEARQPGRWLARVAALLMGLALIATQSAAAIGAVGITLFFAAVWFLPQPERWAFIRRLIVLGLVAGMYFIFTGRGAYLTQPRRTGEANSVSVRQQLWSIGAELVSEGPLLGVGLGQFEGAYQQKLHERFAAYEEGLVVRAPLPEFVFRDPHNWLLSFWLNTGLLGLISFAALNLYSLARWWRSRKNGHTNGDAVGLALICLLLFGLVDTIYWKNDLAVLHWVFLSLTILAWKV